MTHSSLIELAARTDACGSCGKQTTVFVGKRYCDECIADFDRSRITSEREQRLRHLVGEGLLQQGTDHARLDWETVAPHNRLGWERAFATDKNLWLFGPCGVGKSYLGRCRLSKAILEGEASRVAETTARRVIKVACRFDEGQGLYQRWAESQWLLLDDIDKPLWTQDAVSALWELLDLRCAANRKTIVTSNMNPKAFAESLANRVPENQSLAYSTLDRLKPIEVIELTGRSLR